MQHKYRVDIHQWRMRHERKYILHNGTFGPNDPIIFSTGRRQAQCVNQPNSYREVNGLVCSLGNAIDWQPGNPECEFVKDSVWVPNSPDNHPNPGATIVFAGGPFDPEFGHTGSARHGSTSQRLCVLWQNDPDYAPLEAVIISYAFTLGWWEPK